MTKVLVHELATQAPVLLERLRRLLREHGTAESQSLLARAVIDARPKPRMVLVGQYSSGKSTLIKALTDGAVDPKIDADIATDEVTEYPWDGEVILVDTPGVESGRREHDDLAWGAIGNSDFILFVVTVDLFDDASARFIRELAHRHQKFDQMIVVITKTSTLSAPNGVREAAVRQALGTVSFTPPVREVDSVYYIRSLSGGPRRDQLRRASGIDELRAEINRISDERGELATLRQPLQLIRQLCDEAQSLFTDDPHERMALQVLAAQRKAVTERRSLIERQFRAAESRFKSVCLVAVIGFVDLALDVDQASGGDAVSRAWQQLQESLDWHARQFAHEVNLLTEQQFDTLASQLAEIDGSNRVAELVRYSGTINSPYVEGKTYAGRERGTAGSLPTDLGWMRQVGDWLKQGHEMWGAGDGVKAALGTFGHKAVKEVGHFFGAKFEPWQAARIANRIGKAAKFVGPVVQVVATMHEVISAEVAALRAESARERRRSAFVTELMAMADEIAANARAELGKIIDPAFNEVLERIDDLRNTIVEDDHARTANSSEVRAIAAEADQLLTLSFEPAVIEVQSAR